MNIPRAAAIVVLVLLVSAGCANDEPISEPQPPVVETPSGNPTSEQTKPEFTDLGMTTEGLGYLAIGSPIEERDPDVALTVWAEGHCDEINPDIDGAWIANYPEGDEAFYFRTEGRDGALTRIMVKGPGVSTDKGIDVGSPESEVMAAYPGATVVTDNPSTRMYVIDGDAGRLLIEVAAEDGLGADIGDVAFMSATDIDDDIWGIANTGAGASCGG